MQGDLNGKMIKFESAACIRQSMGLKVGGTTVATQISRFRTKTVSCSLFTLASLGCRLGSLGNGFLRNMPDRMA